MLAPQSNQHRRPRLKSFLKMRPRPRPRRHHRPPRTCSHNNRPRVQAAIKQHEQDGSWQVFRTDQTDLYPYGQGPDPVIDCEPLRSTDIQLQSEETITDVVMGDSERWQERSAASGDPRNPVPQVAIKPQAPGIKTNLAGGFTPRATSIT